MIPRSILRELGFLVTFMGWRSALITRSRDVLAR